MSSDLDARGTGGSSGNGITDAQRGLVSPRSASASKQAGKQDVHAQPAAPAVPQSPQSFGREETERMVQEEIRRLRPQIPTHFTAYELILFDSIFYSNPQYDHANFDFRGTRMQGWELNYYFTGMALAHFGNWLNAEITIDAWNLLQETLRYVFDGRANREFRISHQLNDRMWWAAQCGFNEERIRMHLPQVPRPDQRQTAPPRRYLDEVQRQRIQQ